jgi:hypothetical protein
VPMAEKTELRQQVAKNQPNESTDVAQR